jgi:chromatin segregation and condensation protein Rec8/ScpA/Scc1 (kleisin family)
MLPLILARNAATREARPVSRFRENKIMKRILTTGLVVIALAAPGAFGQRIENRKERQKARVEEGEKSGELTKAEAARIKARQRALNRQVREDRRDGGGMTAAERAKIEKRQDNISESIYRQKHDGQKTTPKP